MEQGGMSIKYSYERLIEDVVLGLLNANSEAIEAVASYGLTTKSAWQLDQKVKALWVEALTGREYCRLSASLPSRPISQPNMLGVCMVSVSGFLLHYLFHL
jgi:hypothetical protein